MITFRYGSVGSAMLTLFQVSTCVWSDAAYASWHGCNNYQKNPGYDISNPMKLDTPYGSFLGFKCEHLSSLNIGIPVFVFVFSLTQESGGAKDIRSPYETFGFYYIYIITTSWVILVCFKLFQFLIQWSWIIDMFFFARLPNSPYLLESSQVSAIFLCRYFDSCTTFVL